MAINAELARIGGDGALLYMGNTIAAHAETNVVATHVTSTTLWTALAEVNSVNPVQECADVDVTSLNSGIYRKFKPGHLSATMSANVNFVQDTGTPKDGLDLLNDVQARQVRLWKLVVPVDAGTNTGTNTTFNLGFVGYINNMSPSITDDDEPMTADLTFRVSDSQMVDAIG